MAEIDADELAATLARFQPQLSRGKTSTIPTDALRELCAAARAHLASLRAPKGELAEKTALVAEPLAWRDPSQAPTNIVVLVVMAAFGTIAMGERTRHSAWRVNEAQCPEHWIAGWLPLEALPSVPPTPGASNG